MQHLQSTPSLRRLIMLSKEKQNRAFNSLVSFLLSQIFLVAPGLGFTAYAQETLDTEKQTANAASGATVRSGNIRLDAETSGLDKPKSNRAMGKIVFREGTVKINNSYVNAGADVTSGALIEAGNDGRALIVLKKKSSSSSSFNPEDLLESPKIQKKKTAKPRSNQMKPPAIVSSESQSPRKKQMGLSKGIDVKRVQYIALVGDAQAKLENNEIAIETREGEAIINQGTSRIFNLSSNSKMRLPAQPQNGITGTLCHGTLTGIAKPTGASGGPNIETNAGIVNFPSGGRFLVEAGGGGQLQQCDQKKSESGESKPSGGIRVVSLDAPGRLILVQRPQTALSPKNNRNEKDKTDDSSNKNEKTQTPLGFSLTDQEPRGNEESTSVVESQQSRASMRESQAKEKQENSKTENQGPSGDKTVANNADAGEKKTAVNDGKEKQKGGGKPINSEDSPLDIDQGKGNDKFIGSDSPAAKGAEKRIALNDEKQHDGDGTRQPGETAKDGKPPQSVKSGNAGATGSTSKSKSDGILEFGAMEDVKAPELPNMKNMTEEQKKEVYKNVAEKTERTPSSKSTSFDLLGQTPVESTSVAANNDVIGLEPKSGNQGVVQESQKNSSASDRTSSGGGPQAMKKGSDEQHGDKKSNDRQNNDEQTNDGGGSSSKSEDERKNSSEGKKKMPLISPPKMSPPPLPKIDTTQMPLSSDVLIKLRKKVK
jgi:hypothetical protein